MTEPTKFVHIDDWLDSAACSQDPSIVYTAFVLHLKRLPATYYISFLNLLGPLPLFCRCEGKVWRCTGASRMGDVYLAENLERENGYDRRVEVTKCSEWSNRPELTPVVKGELRFALVDKQTLASLDSQAIFFNEGGQLSAFQTNSRKILGFKEKT